MTILFTHVVQEDALEEIAHVLHQHEIGGLPDTKPVVLMFAGPTRCGKTETAEQISRVLTQQPIDRQFFLNMGQYQLEHEVAKLNGAPPGYGKDGDPDGVLASLAGRHRPIVLLDEVEKAHPRALVWFLSVFDRGEFSTTSGKLIDCKSAIFIMTTNIGSDHLAQKAAKIRGSSSQERQALAEKELRPLFLQKGWTPEFWARIDSCIPFLPLSEEQQVDGARHFLKVMCNDMYIMICPELVMIPAAGVLFLQSTCTYLDSMLCRLEWQRCLLSETTI